MPETNDINLLSDDCINKIAAGEVVDRPSSVVKELVDNALDSGASIVRIIVEEGGKKLIKVTDNGLGMTKSNLGKCCARHATSKITCAEDLYSIQSYGFRGEALSSIAAVSNLTILSRHQDQNQAYSICVDDKGMGQIAECACDQGTTVIVQNLFYNTPVRKKFLATDQTETTRILEMVTRLALSRPEVSFSLHQNQKELLKTRSGDYNTRVSEIFGASLFRKLIPMNADDGYLKIQGFIGHPDASKGRRSHQYFFLNQRPVWNPALAKALSNAYEALNPGKHAICVLWLELPLGEFDINIHPSKREVRFIQPSLVYSSLSRSVREALRHNLISNSGISIRPTITNHSASSILTQHKSTLSFGHYAYHSRQHNEDTSDLIQDLFSTPENTNIISISPEQLQKKHENFESDAKINNGGTFFQLQKTFIICENSEGLLIFDQNALHQRILYEDALRKFSTSTQTLSQQLLFPELLDFTSTESQILREYSKNLEQLGYEVTPFGTDCFQLRAIPVDLAQSRGESSLRELVENFAHDQSNNLQEKLSRAFARASALKKGDSLNQEQMSILVDQLFGTEMPWISPSGKPTLLKLPIEDILKHFKRNG
jgi:DNA mismatch repair protein MutL